MKKAYLAVLGLVAVTLASCGGTTSTGTSTGGESTSTETSTDIVQPAGTKEIQFWHCIGHDKMKNLQRIVDQFNNAHASTDGYYVKPYQIAGSYDALHDSVKTKLNAGFVPSITMGYPDSFAEYIGSQGASKSKILNLSSFISSDTSFKPSEFVPQYYNEGSGYQYEGVYSLPLYKSTEVMYYNKTMFEGSKFYAANKDKTYGSYSAKLGDPSTWDWDTLTYVAGEIQAEYKTTSDFHALGYDSDSNLFISQMAQRNIPYTTASGTKADHFLFVDTATAKPNADLLSFSQNIYNLTTAGSLVTQGSYGSYASDLFLKKKVMFTIGSTGGSAYNEPGNSFDCGLTTVPTYQNTNKYIMQGPSLCFFNTSNTAKEAASWEFYSKYISDATLNAQLALENSYDPVKTSSYDTDDYKDWIADGRDSDGNEDVTAELQYRIPALTSTLKDNYITSPVFIGSSTARTQIGSIIKYAKEQNGDVSKAIIQAYSNCVLNS
ncbi:MAG: hypothetical protein WCR67_00635 [Bacilli bacterium]